MDRYSLENHYNLITTFSGRGFLSSLRKDIRSLRGFGGVMMDPGTSIEHDSYDLLSGTGNFNGTLEINYFLKDIAFVKVRLPSKINLSISSSAHSDSLDVLVKKYSLRKE